MTGFFNLGSLVGLLAIAAPVLVGCSYVLTIRIDGPAEKPIFRVTSAGGSIQPCITSFSIVPASSPRLADALWDISSDDSCLSVDQIVYGDAPSGFRTLKHAGSLEAGRVYIVRATRPGAEGQIRIRYEGGMYNVVETPEAKPIGKSAE